MTVSVASLWRHPIKAVGREALSEVALWAGRTMPGDRIWAVAHEASDAQQGSWARCLNFIRAASSPKLMAVTARSDGAVVHLSHPDRPDLSVNPDTQGDALITWLRPLISEGRAAPSSVLRAPDGRGMTDSSAPSVTLGNLTSHRIVEARLGRPVSLHRWRCNLWIDGLAPWEEFDLVGKRLRIGSAELDVYARVTRCEATSANPDTGRRDADLLSVLREYDHQDFTVAANVVKDGTVALGDRMEVL